MLKKNKFQSIFFTLSLISIFLLTSSTPALANLEMNPPNIDGLIGDTEWTGLDIDDTFYIYADTSDGNIDGDNRLLIGEDEENLYIGLDLNSDQTVDPSSEWVGIWLNTNNSTFSDEYEWARHMNDGVESLIVNVSSMELWEPWGDPSFPEMDQYIFTEEDVLTPAIYSDYYGVYGDLESNDDSYYGLNSTSSIGYEVTRLDIEYNISTFYGNLFDEYTDHIQGIRFNLGSILNSTINSHRVVAWKPDGTLDLDDPNQYFSGTTIGGSIDYWNGYFNSGNLTSDNILKISLIANSSLDFEVLYEYLHCYIETDSLNHGSYDDDLINRPFSTILNAEYAYGFGPSSLNSTDHRQFEFKIPKSELEHYDSNQELGIIVGGYGTLSFDGKDYWVYSEDMLWINEEDSTTYIYYDMQGVESSYEINITSPGDITYEVGQTGYKISWTINDTYIHKPMYIVYLNGIPDSSGGWTSGSSIIVDVDHLNPGVYNYKIVAFDGYGSSIQDEVIVSVTNEIPTLNSPDNINISVQVGSATINWTISDISVLNPTYSIYVNGTLNTTGVWVSGELISINIENLTIGIYNIKLIVNDGYGGITEDEVIIVIDGGIPGFPNYLLIGIVILSISILSNQKKKKIHALRKY